MLEPANGCETDKQPSQAHQEKVPETVRHKVHRGWGWRILLWEGLSSFLIYRIHRKCTLQISQPKILTLRDPTGILASVVSSREQQKMNILPTHHSRVVPNQTKVRFAKFRERAPNAPKVGKVGLLCSGLPEQLEGGHHASAPGIII